MKPVILVADSGSSKTDWRLTSGDQVASFSSQGFNPFFVGEKEIVGLLETQIQDVIARAGEISEIHFFGAGCSSPDKREVISNALSVFFPQAFINVESDLLASAYATCGHKSGISCVLGTGSNISFYDGESVHPGNFGLGYVLGDEGSGVSLGKRLITDYLYKRMPEYIHAIFKKQYGITKEAVIERVYQKPSANTYMASFGVFLSRIRTSDYAQMVLADNFEEFICTNIQSYADYRKYPVHFVGSIAWHFQEELRNQCAKHQVTVGVIIRKPIDRLYEFIYEQITA